MFYKIYYIRIITTGKTRKKLREADWPTGAFLLPVHLLQQLYIMRG